MAGSANPDYNPAMQSLPIPENDVDVQPMPMIDWGAPILGALKPIPDALVGESVPPGQPFIRRVSTNGQADVSDPEA